MLSAVAGLQTGVPSLSNSVVVGVTCAILVALFVAQRYGSNAVGVSFAPIVVVWLSANAAIGIYK